MLYRKFKPEKYSKTLTPFFKELLNYNKVSEKKLRKLLSKYPKDGNKIFSKDELIQGFKYLKETEEISKNTKLPPVLQMKPTRTISGVTTVTVLTKPFPCPGKCIFCPNDIRMPKSYIATEPGAQRALANRFSPYLQVFNRLKALKSIGHPTDKIELLVLGGTWSYYPKNYRIWYITECFRAMNEFGTDSKTSVDPIFDRTIVDKWKNFNKKIRTKVGDKDYNALIGNRTYKDTFNENVAEGPRPGQGDIDLMWKELEAQQKKNEIAGSRCVGLVLETRPDAVNAKEVFDLRKLGATKIQIGVQSLDDRISELNKRGETKAQVANAFKLLRAGGFKIHAHIMPNLYGSTLKKDLDSYKELFGSIDYKPDELKIYPTSLIKNTELYEIYKRGKYKPYSTHSLINLLADMLEITPRYCRLTRIVRDIPAGEIEAGNKRSNIRELIEQKLLNEKRQNLNIRAREIKGKIVKLEDLRINDVIYKTAQTTEHFLEYITEDEKIAGFLRLSLPDKRKYENSITTELNNSAIIREVHVYGPSLGIGKDSSGQAQHLGLGTRLIEEAKALARNGGFGKLSVISAIGTREYYRKKGFKDGELYQWMGI